MLRIDLAYQKKYLMVLLARSERGYVPMPFLFFDAMLSCFSIFFMLNRDEKIVASIARIGFPVAPVVQKTSKKRKTVRAVALGVMFLQRAR